VNSLRAPPPAHWQSVLDMSTKYNSKRQMDRLADDYRDERISRSEYERRKEQLDRGSIIY